MATIVRIQLSEGLDAVGLIKGLRWGSYYDYDEMKRTVDIKVRNQKVAQRVIDQLASYLIKAEIIGGRF